MHERLRLIQLDSAAAFRRERRATSPAPGSVEAGKLITDEYREVSSAGVAVRGACVPPNIEGWRKLLGGQREKNRSVVARLGRPP